MFYMNENDPYDLIEFWNMRATGWSVAALPAPLAPKLRHYCTGFLRNAYERDKSATFVCSKSLKQADMHAFVNSLHREPDQKVPYDGDFPDLWNEAERIARHAEPDIVTHASKTVRASLTGEGLQVETALPDFLEHDFAASTDNACANVLESVAGGSPVIPWRHDLSSMIHDMGPEKTYVSRDGIVFLAGAFSSTRYMRIPSPMNVYTAVAASVGYDLKLSPAGHTCQQIIKGVGSMTFIRIVAKSPELLKYINRMAHEDVEVEIDVPESEERKKKKVAKAYAPYNDIKRMLTLNDKERFMSAEAQLSNLVHRNILRVGLTQRCPECLHTSWFGLDEIGTKFTCPRCSTEFPFPGAVPPERKEWAYRVAGPFAAENFAHGAYCVISAMALIGNDWRNRVTWIPSFELTSKDGKKKPFEADFSMFINPGTSTQLSSPSFVIGECKSFNKFETRDYERARQAMDLFPGVALCFATVITALTDCARSAILVLP